MLELGRLHTSSILRLFLPAEFGPNRLVCNYSLKTQKPDGRFPYETVMGGGWPPCHTPW